MKNSNTKQKHNLVILPYQGKKENVKSHLDY